MEVKRAHLASLVWLSLILTASTAVAQVRLHAPGGRQGYIVTESGSVKVRPYSAFTQAIHWQFGMAPGGGATYDLRHQQGATPQLRFSATANDGPGTTTDPNFPAYAAGVEAELKKPGGPLDPSTFFFPLLGLNAVRTAGNRYVVAFVADGKPAATVVEFEGTSNGSMLTAGSARLEAIAGSTVTNQLVGPGFNGKYVVIGGAAKTAIIGYSNGLGGAVVAQVDNPAGYQYLSSGPSVGNPDLLWVVAVKSDRSVKIFALGTGGYFGESQAIDPQLALAASDRLVPAFDGTGKCVLVAYRAASGPFSRKTSVRVIDLGSKSLVAGATRDDGPDFSQSALPPPVAATSTGTYLVGKATGDPSAALYSVSMTSGALSKVTLTGGGFGGDEPTSLLSEAPPTTTVSDAAPIAAGQPAVFTVTRSAASTEAVTVTYQTVDGTAQGGTDYTAAANGSVVFEPGALTKTINVATLASANCKAERNFKVRLTGAFAASSPKAEGVATIQADQGCATAIVSGGGGVCRGGSTTITATFAGTAPWIATWSDGVQATYTTSPATRTVSPQATTTYTITSLTSQGKQGAASGSATVTVVDASQPPRITLKDTLAPNEQATATVTGEDGIAFTWEAQENGLSAPGVILGGQGTSKATIRPTKAGLLTLTAARTGGGCGGASELKIAVTAASSPRLLLQNGRVSVQVAWRHAYAPGIGGIAESVPDAAAKETLGSFHFGDAGNPELFVKILDFAEERTFPVFYGGLTDFEYLVTFRVEATGETARFAKAAFDTTKAGGTKLKQAGSRWEGDGTFSEEEAREALADGVTYLQLSKERILVGVKYRNPYVVPPPALASATPLSKGDGFGYFYIDGPGNPELFVKVLDRTEEQADKSYALFYTGLTDFEYEATFLNAETGQVLTFAKGGQTFAGGVSGELQFVRERIPDAATTVPDILVRLGDGTLAPRDGKRYWQVNAGVPVTFSAPTAVGSFLWDFADGTTSTSVTPVHTFGGSGLLVVRLTAGNGHSVAVVRVGSCPAIALSPGSLPNGTSGQPYQQTLTASGGAAPYSYSVTAGTIPTGLALNGAVITGTPSAPGSFTFTVTARDANSCAGSRSYTIEIASAPIDCTKVTIQIAPDQLPEGFAGAPYSQTLSASGGVGNYTYLLSGQPPSGLALVNGSSLRWNDPIAGTFSFSIEASDSNLCKGTKAYTLTVNPATTNQAPAITSANATTFQVGAQGSFAVTASGNPAPAITLAGSLPSGVTFTAGSGGTGALSGTPAAGTAGSYPITFTATNGVQPNATQSFTLTVSAAGGTAPTITSGNAATFQVGTAGTFAVTATGSPAATITVAGSLPGGVTFTGGSNGSGTLSGTPTAGTAGSYPITFTATNGIQPNATQSFTLTVSAASVAPAITSANAVTFTVGTAGTFAVTATGSPTPTITQAGALPSGITFTGGSNGAGTLSGTPAAGTAGSYPITLTATNGIQPNATQSFTLTVTAASVPPTITSGNAVTFQTGTPGTFSVTATGSPTPTITQAGSLPAGVTFTGGPNGAGALSGTPAAGTTGTYPITFTAKNGVPPDATQSFTLTITAGPTAPTITSPNVATFQTNAPGTFSVTTTGNPAPTISQTGALPPGVAFANNGNGTATLSGTPSSAGTYQMTLTASNGILPNATQAFTLAVNSEAAITSANAATFTVGTPGSFAVTAGGTPTPTITYTGTLPSGVTFVGGAGGSGTLSGTPAAGTDGIYPIIFVAANGAPSNGTQGFTLTVVCPTIILAPASGAITPGIVGVAGYSQSFTASGGGGAYTYAIVPATPPAGLSFNTGTGALTGTPNAAGTFNFTVRATESTGCQSAVTSYSLTVVCPTLGLTPAAGAITGGIVGIAYPGVTFAASGGSGGYTYAIVPPTAPAGLSFNTGTGALTGTPNATGTFNFTVRATDSTGCQSAVTSYSLTVNAAPAITSANAATFTIGMPGSFEVTAAGIPTPTITYTGTLPSGVTFTGGASGSGTLSGTPAAETAGIYPIIFVAANGVPPNGTQDFTLTVVCPTITLAPASGAITGGTVGVAGYSQSFTASGGVGAYTYAIVPPAAPAGLSFNTGTGALTGTPTAIGTFNFTVRATDTGTLCQSAVTSYSLTVVCPTLGLTPAAGAITGGTVGASYPGVTFAASGGSGGYTYAIVPPTAPAGLSFNTGTGALTGTPNATGTFNFTVRATDSTGCQSAVTSYSLTVVCPTLGLSPAAGAITGGTVGVAYPGVTFTASGGSGGYTYAIVPPTAPAGLSFDTGTGALTGTPNATGTFNFTVRATDSTGCQSAVTSYSLAVNAAPAITSANATTFQVGAAGTFTVTTTGSPAPTISRTGTLPTGVTFTNNGNGTGTLGGLPGSGTAGTYPMTFTAANGVGSNAVQSFTLTVNAPICTSFTLSPTSANPTAVAGSVPVSVTGAPAACQGGNWNASGNGSWLTVEPTSGTGTGSVTVSWTQNTSSARSANATIAGSAFPVTQAGAAAVCLYEQTFTTDPQWTSLAPSYAFWDSAQGNYYVNTRDNLDNAYVGYSPPFTAYDGSSDLAVTFDVQFASPNFGTYPGVRFVPEPMTASNLEPNFSFVFLHFWTSFTGNVMSIYDKHGHQYYSTNTVQAGLWYHVVLTYSGALHKLDMTISAGAVLTSLTAVDFVVDPFQYVAAGYYGDPDYGNNWSPIRLDNLQICAQAP